MNGFLFRIRMVGIVVGLLVALMPGCVQQAALPKGEQTRHVEARAKQSAPTALPLMLSGVAQGLQDPYGTASRLENAVNASLNYVVTQPASEVAVYLPVISDSYSAAGGNPAMLTNTDGIPGQIAVTYADMQKVLARLQAVLPTLENQEAILQSEFRWVLVGSFGFTGYYEPVFQASRTTSGPFSFPLYGTWGSQPLAWVSDPVDSAILQLQGSGRLDFQDGTHQFVEYAGVGSSELSPRQILANANLLPAQKISNLKKWLMTHPAARQAILRASNPHRLFARASYGPTGNMGARLSPWISAATDQNVLPNGLVTVMSLSIPNIGNFQGIMLPQDTGGGIIGNRVDIFCGSGYGAESSAADINAVGSVYVLLPKVE